MLWIKAFHIIFVVCWFAGIFYLPRLFVNHALVEDQATRHQLAIMEGKLYRFMSIFALLTLVFGAWLTTYNWSYYIKAGWFHSKLFLIFCLLAYHLKCGHYVKKFKAGEIKHGHVFFRWFNELPVLILFVVVILVVVKPF
jgi:putative membrane protein